MGKFQRIHKKELLDFLDEGLPKLRAGMSLLELAASRRSYAPTVYRSMQIHRLVEYRAAMIEGRKAQISALERAGDTKRARQLLRTACQLWPDVFTWPWRKPASEWGKPRRKQGKTVPIDILDIVGRMGNEPDDEGIK